MNLEKCFRHILHQVARNPEQGKAEPGHGPDGVRQLI